MWCFILFSSIMWVFLFISFSLMLCSTFYYFIFCLHSNFLSICYFLISLFFFFTYLISFIFHALLFLFFIFATYVFIICWDVNFFTGPDSYMYILVMCLMHLSGLYNIPKHLALLNYNNNFVHLWWVFYICMGYITYQNIWLFFSIKIICVFVMCLRYLSGSHHIPKYLSLFNHKNNLCICDVYFCICLVTSHT